MEIDVSVLRKQYIEFQKKLDEYDGIYLDFYKELKQAEFCWKDNISSSFFSYCWERKSKIELYIMEIKEISNIYKFIIDKYSQLGNKIKIQLNNKEQVMEKVNQILDYIDDLIAYYGKIDLSFCPFEAGVLRNQLNKMKQNRNKIAKMKNELNNIYNSIASIERNVASRIDKFNMGFLTRIDVSEFV